MDKIDTIILNELQKNSRIPSEELACMLEITENEVERRIAALKDAGILRSCTAVIDYSATDDDNVMVILSLKVTPEKGLGYDGIAEKISKFPQVESIHLMTGTYDFQVIIHGKTMTEVSRFVAEQIASIDGVRETMTQIIMRTYKEQGVPMMRLGNRDRQLITF
ncbi:MAG TPA: Lrp/AsnC family transcriptional regulator [Methanocorpusculum sp.]|nr:Lrp/AsnC family transcriptional regulator [Methanocorpusculum sp.]HJJ40060.1 Lrp/AsnC family transcriptional regulator [Methanocorpusculum sp.]HJJ49543.1 Lrp/AsnC family transcriptional regulator [Methanocorpusculum sp.]HJJ57095.1 Lrp/AsnC family transcriptional regulator [Methanocorpusculum sp.]HJJ94989.1 Lrp/AsnC family transcriptional regulator [Methanocorpusculum sp.]